MSLDSAEFTEHPLKFDPSDTAAFHRILVKENESRTINRLKPAGRTLFVLNVPPYATEASLAQAFSVAGPVASVLLQEKPSEEPEREDAGHKFKVAYVVFEKASAARKVLERKCGALRALNEDGGLVTGMDKWRREFEGDAPDPVELQREIDEYMAGYDREVQKQKRVEEEEGGEADDEGWVTVTKASVNTFTQREATIAKMEEKMSKDRRQKELKNFYTFQIRESKKNDIVSLRKKYDRDLQKMEQIKKTKRFKPY
uniref:Hipothetical protein n=1 Tax=Culex tarsalis TaxID=7177 RepID=A0A1Q3FW51_CULTA